MIIMNKYLILEEIGKGGMGIVYRAKDEKVGRVVAIKELVIPNNISENDRNIFIERFKREAITASSLNHPNIVTVFDFGESYNRHFIAMEFLKGENLKDFFTNNNLPINDIISIFIQAGEGINFAHNKNIIHRDIKPANIQILSDNTVKITDFGIAKDKNKESSLTQNGSIFGTLGYISLEQVNNARLVDQRADIYSFGAMMYEVITGNILFDGDNLGATIYKILMAKPKPIREIKHDIPENLELIILKCLEKDPKDRYQSIKDVVKELKLVISDNDFSKIIINSQRSNQIEKLDTKTLNIEVTQKIDYENQIKNKSINMTRGQKIIVKDYIDSESFTIGVNWTYKNTPVNIDLSAIMLSESEKMEREEDFIFYNNLISGCGSIRLDKSENLIYKNIIDINLKLVPEYISRIKIIINAENKTLKELENIEFNLISENDNFLNYNIDDFNTQKTGVIADIYKHKNQWKIQATGEAYNLDLLGFLKEYISDSIIVQND